MNPGDTPLARRPNQPAGALNEGRGVNPGDTVATTRDRVACSRALNEGRA